MLTAWHRGAEMHGLLLCVSLGIASAAFAADRMGIDYTFTTPSEGDLEGKVEQHEFRAGGNAALLARPVNQVDVSVGGAFQANVWTFDDHAVEDLEVYKIKAPVSVGFEGFKSIPMQATVAPGLHSDLERVDDEDFRVEGSLMGFYAVSENLTIALGAAYGEEFGDPQLYPLGGLIWKASPDLLAELVFPSPKISYTLNPDLKLFVAGEPTGGEWNLRRENEDYDFRQKGFRVGIGGEYQVVDGGWLFAMAGSENNRSLQVAQDDEEIFGEDVDLDNCTFVQIGFRLK